MKLLVWIRRADKLLAAALKGIAVGLCALIALLLLCRVILRLPFFTASMAWSEEVIELTMAWMILIMAALLFRNGEHFRLDLLEKKLAGKPLVKYLNLLITMINLLFVAALFYYGIKFMLPQAQFSPILKINHRFFYASVPVNAGLMMLYLLRDLVRNVLAFRRLGPVPQAAERAAGE